MRSLTLPFHPRIRTAASRLGAIVLVAAAGGCAKTSSQPERNERAEKPMGQTIRTFLMFEGNAEEAINFYVSLFDNAEIVSVRRYGPEGPGQEGSVYRATFTLGGREFMCFDSPAKHNFTFTPAISLFVTSESEAKVDELFARLSEGGQVLMPLDKYPFSRKFGWVQDRFGVSWQLSLPLE